MEDEKNQNSQFLAPLYITKFQKSFGFNYSVSLENLFPQGHHREEKSLEF